MVDDVLLTTVEVADRLRVKPRFIYSEVHAGRLVAIRLGKRNLRFRLADVERYVTAGQVLSPGDSAADK